MGEGRGGGRGGKGEERGRKGAVGKGVGIVEGEGV